MFEYQDSIAEVVGVSAELDRADVYLVGPNQVQAVQDLIGSLLPSDIENIMDGFEKVNEVKGAIEALGQSVAEAHQNPSETSIGTCLWSFDSGCVQLIYPDGFDSVYSCSGLLCLPSPVLVLVHDMDGIGGHVFWSGVFSFMPTEP